MRGGQAIVVVLLTLAVAMTLGLSLALRTSTETGVSTAQEESQRALRAAETGLEQALSTGSFSGGSVGNYAYTLAQATIAPINELSLPRVQAGEGVSVRLPGAATTLYLCWGDGDLELATYDTASYIVSKRQVHSVVGNTNCPDDNRTYTKASSVVLTADDDLAVLRLFNITAAQPIGVRVSSGSFPSQGMVTTAQGNAGQTVRKVEVSERSDTPSIFDFALFSGANIQ